MNPNRFKDAEQLRDAGVHLTPYGLPEYPKAAEVSKLQRQIARGIPMPSGDTFDYEDEMTAVLAHGWLFPDQMIPQFRSPRYKSTRAGMAATVSGLMAFTALQTNPFNPRANAKLAIPLADTRGRVAMPWAPTDRKADPHNESRMLVQVADRDELNHRVLESERHIVGEQPTLAGLIAREAIEEDVLAIVVRYETAGLNHQLAATTVDGNSRLAIARARYREWMIQEREEILAVVRSARPRAALAHALDVMSDGLFPLEHADPVTLRHLHKAIESTLDAYSTEDVIEHELFAIPNLFVVPVTMIVAFEPAGDDSTVLDAADQMMRNVHHPSRAPKTWEHAAGHAEIRDEVVGKLHDNGALSIGEALYLGPRYEEAIQLHHQPEEPDRRAYAAIDFVNGDHDLGKDARALIADAIGTRGAARLLRAQIITSILSEQLHSMNTSVRKLFETTISDVLNTNRFGSVTKTPPEAYDDPAELLAAVEEDVADGIGIEDSPAATELGIKGAIALAANGHLARTYGSLLAEAPRPYTIVENMLSDPFGRKLLAKAIKAWRNDSTLREHDIRSRRPIRGAPAMRPVTLAAMFTATSTSTAPAETAEGILSAMRKILADRFQPLLDKLLAMPEVRREGAPSDQVQEVLNILEPAQAKLGLQKAKFDEFHAEGQDDDELPEADEDDAKASLR